MEHGARNKRPTTKPRWPTGRAEGPPSLPHRSGPMAFGQSLAPDWNSRTYPGRLRKGANLEGRRGPPTPRTRRTVLHTNSKGRLRKGSNLTTGAVRHYLGPGEQYCWQALRTPPLFFLPVRTHGFRAIVGTGLDPADLLREAAQGCELRRQAQLFTAPDPASNTAFEF